MQTALENPGMVSLAAGFVDQQSLPVEAAARAVSDLFQDAAEGRRSLQYGTTIGDPRLRALLIGRLERTEGVPEGTFEEAIARTVVTTGSAQLIYLVCEALLDPGDIVLVESPTYFVFLGPVETRGARAVRVPIDEHGLNIDALEAMFRRIRHQGQLDRVKLVYTIPEHANPTGISLAEGRRKPLVDLVRRWSAAANRRIFLLEDAAYHGLSYGIQEPPCLWSLDPEGETVILARTFSKTYSPGVKIGYGILPRGLIDPILSLKGNHDFGSANFNQQLLERTLASGDYDRHVARLRELYGRKRDVFVGALERYLEPVREDVRWTHPNGGLFVWMTVPEGLDTGFNGPLFPRCLQEGVLYVPGEYAFASEPGPVPRNHLRLTFGVPSEAELVEGARRLAAALRGCLGAGG
jgi:2-aminoadipate transaminase